MNSPTRALYRFTVPPTSEQGSHAGNCSASYGETRAANALSDYNSARAHDGLPPLSRMPKGTRYTRATVAKMPSGLPVVYPGDSESTIHRRLRAAGSAGAVVHRGI